MTFNGRDGPIGVHRLLTNRNIANQALAAFRERDHAWRSAFALCIDNNLGAAALDDSHAAVSRS